MKKIVPVVFATNKKYFPYLGVAVSSLIRHVRDEYDYKLYVLHTSLSRYDTDRLEGLGTNNVEIECINISHHVKELELYSSLHLSEEAVYRILIPEVLPEYEKIIYLDCDLVLFEDIAKCFEEELEGCLLGAVHDVLFDDIEKHVKDDLKLQPELCFNSGVLLIDTERFKKENIRDKALALLAEDRKRKKRKYIYLDQDVLNIVCQEKVFFLERRWNFQWQYLQPDRYARVTDKETYLEAGRDPYILHFAGDIKPWHEPDREMAYFFWDIARSTVFYEEILFKNILEQNRDCFKEYIFPFHKVEPFSRIVLYGAGRVGKAFRRQMELTGYCKISAWVDQNYQILRGENPFISSPAEIKNLCFDYLVIAIENERTAKIIEGEQVLSGIERSRIVWSASGKEQS